MKHTQLHIRNEHAGMIWQIYNINNAFEAETLTENARRNGFTSFELIQKDYEETFPGWRESEGWIQILKDNADDPRMLDLF